MKQRHTTIAVPTSWIVGVALPYARACAYDGMPAGFLAPQGFPTRQGNAQA